MRFFKTLILALCLMVPLFGQGDFPLRIGRFWHDLIVYENFWVSDTSDATDSLQVYYLDDTLHLNLVDATDLIDANVTINATGLSIAGVAVVAGSWAPADAKYIVQQADGDLSAEQALGALATGILKNTTTSGVLSIAVAGDIPDLSGIYEVLFVNSAGLAAAVNDETGTGVVAFGTAPTFTTSATVQGLTGAASVIYITADAAEDDTDKWKMEVADGGNWVFADYGSGAWVTDFTIEADGDAVILGDLTITGDDLFMTTNTAGYILRADNANYNPVKFDDSGDLAGFLDDETGTGLVVFDTAPTFASTIAVTGLASLNAGTAIKNGAASAGFIDLYEDSDDGGNYTQIIVPALAGDLIFQLPNTDGDNLDVLTTDGNGALSWVAPAGGGGAPDDDFITLGDVVPQGVDSLLVWDKTGNVYKRMSINDIIDVADFSTITSDFAMTKGNLSASYTSGLGGLWINYSITSEDILISHYMYNSQAGDYFDFNYYDEANLEFYERYDPTNNEIFFYDNINTTKVWSVDADLKGKFTIGSDLEAGVDWTLRFLGADDEASIVFMEDEDEFLFPDVVGIDTSLVSDTYNFAADGEASDTYVIALDPIPDDLNIGQIFVFTANTLNTDGATLNVNGLGAKNILKMNDQALVTGDIEAGQVVVVVYDGTSMQMISHLAQ